MQRRERALLTGMFAVRNHVATRLAEFEAGGQLSTLSSLRTAQSYVHRLIDKAPGEGEHFADHGVVLEGEGWLSVATAPAWRLCPRGSG